MQTTFLELHDSAMNCLSKNPDMAAVGFGNNLKDLTERFLSLAKGALGSSEGAESGDEDAEGESINEEENGGARSKRRRSRDDGSPGSGGMQGGGGGGGSVPSYGGYQVSYSRENGNGRGGSRSSYDNSGNQNRSAGGGSGRNNTMTTNSPLSLNSQDLRSSSSSESERARELSRSSTTGLPYSVQHRSDIPLGLDASSYAFHETSFSRRLHRAGLEHAHTMLSSPNVDQREVARLFAYTLCYISKEKALETVSMLLRANSKESLNPRDYPGLNNQPASDYADTQKHENHKTGGRFEDAEHMDGGALDLAQEAGKIFVKLGIDAKYLGPDEVVQYITDLGILSATDMSTVDPDLMDVDAELRGSHQKSQAAFPAVTKPRSPSAAVVHRPQVASLSQQGGFTSATVMEFEYPPSHEDQAKYDKYIQPETMGKAKSSTRALEGVKNYVDLDTFVKRMSLPNSTQMYIC